MMNCVTSILAQNSDPLEQNYIALNSITLETCTHHTNLVWEDITLPHLIFAFTGLYIVWDSFCAKSYKINLVRNLVDRAHRICSKSLLEAVALLPRPGEGANHG